MGVLETIAALLIVAALALFAGRRLWRTVTGRERCGGCGGACRGDLSAKRGAKP
jgi:hypothetical protein